MGSNNWDPFLGSAEVDDSPYKRRARRIGKMIADLVDGNDRFREEGARLRFAPIIADLEARVKAAKASIAQVKADAEDRINRNNAKAEACAAQAKIYAEAVIAQHTSELEDRNVQMVETITETVEKLKRDAAARVAAAESDAQDRIDDIRDETHSQIRQLSQDLDRHVDMLGLARKHTRWAAHKLILLLIELKEKKRFPDKDLLVHCLDQMFQELAAFRNDCDEVLDSRLLDDDEPDWGPVPGDEGGALLNRTYGNSSEATSPINTEEPTNQPEAPASPNGTNATDEQAIREGCPLFMDDHQQSNCSAWFIKSEGEDTNQQLGASTNSLWQLEQGHADLSSSTKRRSGSEGQAGYGDKRQRNE